MRSVLLLTILCAVAAIATGMGEAVFSGIDLGTARAQTKTPATQSGQSTSRASSKRDNEQQDQAPSAEKDARRAAQQKIDSRLISALKAVSSGTRTTEPDVMLDSQGRTVVDISVKDLSLVQKNLGELRAEVMSTAGDTIRARVNIEDLETIAGWPEVVFVSSDQDAKLQSSEATIMAVLPQAESKASNSNTVNVVPNNRHWTSTGSTGTFDEDSVTKLMVQDFTTRLRDGITGTAMIRYNITATQGISAFCPATQSVVNVRFRNSDNAGTHARVKFEIHRTNIVSGGNDIILAFNSNGLGAGGSFTTASIAPNIDFDFRNYIYWIEATVFRDDPAQFADLGSIDIYESAGTPCP